MAVIDLSKRLTTVWDEYQQQKGSVESKVFIEGKRILDNEGTQCINFTVGDEYFSKGKTRKVSSNGIKLKPGEVFVIETEQRIAVPLNAFGLVFGVGVNIFSGGFVSAGKIDPGFNGKLKIGFYNGNSRRMVFKKGDVIASASFWDTESSLPYPLPDYHNATPIVENIRWIQTCVLWLGQNWYSILALIIAVATLIVSMHGGGK